jgi:hypothetical protein
MPLPTRASEQPSADLARFSAVLLANQITGIGVGGIIVVLILAGLIIALVMGRSW